MTEQSTVAVQLERRLDPVEAVRTRPDELYKVGKPTPQFEPLACLAT